MARPKKNRNLNCNPKATYFKPRGIPLHELKSLKLERDELESLKLADYESKDHETSASIMKISRATFGRILKSARSKVATAIIKGNAIEMSE